MVTYTGAFKEKLTPAVPHYNPILYFFSYSGTKKASILSCLKGRKLPTYTQHPYRKRKADFASFGCSHTAQAAHVRENQ